MGRIQKSPYRREKKLPVRRVGPRHLCALGQVRFFRPPYELFPAIASALRFMRSLKALATTLKLVTSITLSLVRYQHAASNL